jgi:hypothetical protein
LANNVIVGGKQGILSEAKVADGRPEMVAVNNILIGTEGGINGGIDDACFTSAASANSNIISKIASYPVAAVGLATTLSTDNFVPYLAITSAFSTLVDAGTDNTLAKFGTNYVLTVDIKGRSVAQKRDIGAYEYNGITGFSLPEYVMENYHLSQSGNTITVKSLSDKPFSMAIVSMTGKIVFSTQVNSSVEFPKNKFGQGVFVLMFNDGTKISSKKVIF